MARWQEVFAETFCVREAHPREGGRLGNKQIWEWLTVFHEESHGCDPARGGSRDDDQSSVLATRAAIKIDAGKFEEEILGGFFTDLG